MTGPDGAGPLAEDLRAIRRGRLFVIGDVLLDVHVAGSAERVSPEAPVPVVLERSRRATLGGAANVAAAAAAMGVEVALAGRVGADAEGEDVERLCAEAGVATAALVRSARVPTIRKTRILAGYQQLVRVDREVVEPATPDEEAVIASAFRRFAAAGRGCLIISDYAKGLLTPGLVRELIAAADSGGVPVVVDPKAPTFERYAGATVIKPNLGEGREALRRAEPVPVPRPPEEEDVAISRAVLAESGARNVVLSLSERGLLAMGDDAGDGERRESRALSVADVSGAGDTMVAFIGMGCAAGLPFSRTLSLANAAAGAVCERLGPATVTPGALMAAVTRSPESPATQKMLTSADHVRWLSGQLRAEGRRIGFANGCFDLLHAGHVALLQRARELSDVLVVGLNSDAGVARLKGPGRPAQAVADRAVVLAGLACVDFVAVFDEDTPIELILALRPHLIVKGGDYVAEDVVGYREAAGWGGRVEIVPLVEGLSTTRLLEAGARR